MQFEKSFILLGISLILIGIAFVLIPIIGRFFTEVDLEKIPWFLLYVYRRNGFVFVTSPILILVSVISLLLHFIRR